MEQGNYLTAIIGYIQPLYNCIGEFLNEHRNASNQLTIDFEKVKSTMYSKITQAVIKTFSLKSSSQLTEGLDEVFQNFKLDDAEIGLEWDIWSGYTVVAKNVKAEELVREVATFIEATYITSSPSSTSPEV